MRFATLALMGAPLALASQQPYQIYLHPSPSSPHSASSIPTLTPDQAKAVFTHHLGDVVSDFDELPADEGMWGHLMGMWNGETEREGRVVIVDGVDSQVILPSTISHTPSFYLPASASADSLLAPYLQKAQSFLQAVEDKLPEYVKDFVDDFEIAGSKAAASLKQELSTLIAMSEKHLIPFLQNLKHSTWEAVRISGLGDVKKGSQEWTQGTESVKAGLESMSQPDSPPLLIIVRPSAQQTFTTPYKRSTPILQRASNASTCYQSETDCNDATTCAGHGKCAVIGKQGDGECWGCKCADGYAGVECQKADYSIPFMLLFFSSVFLIVLVIGSIMLLSSVGDTKLPSTLTLAVGGPAKRD